MQVPGNNKNNQTVAVLLVFILLAAIRLYHIGTAPLELEESWRQADTESIARNFAEYSFDIFYPNFNYDGPLPNVPALELQVTTYMIAILYKLLGFNYLWARIVPACFFLASAVLLYRLSHKYLDFPGAIISLIVYGAIPINVYYSRAIMPESAGLFFFIGGLYYFDLWLSSNRTWQLFISALLISLSLMTKPMTVFITMPMFYLLIKKYGLNWLFSGKLWLYAFITLGLAAAYYRFSIPIADYKFTQGLARDVLLKKLPSAVIDPQSYKFIARKLVVLLTPAGIMLALLGLIGLNKEQQVISVWFTAMLLEVILVVSVIRIYYYFIFFAVPCCLLIGQGLSLLYRTRHGHVVTILLLALLLVNSYLIVKPMYKMNTVMETQVRIVRQLTEKEDLLVVGSLDPCLLGLSGRRGWRFNLGIYPDIPPDDLEELSLYISKGAKYFIPIQGTIYTDENGALMKHLDKSYTKIEPKKGFPIYKLQ